MIPTERESLRRQLHARVNDFILNGALREELCELYQRELMFSHAEHHWPILSWFNELGEFERQAQPGNADPIINANELYASLHKRLDAALENPAAIDEWLRDPTVCSQFVPHETEPFKTMFTLLRQWVSLTAGGAQ